MNERIREPQVRVIGSEGEQLGVMTAEDALAAADSELTDNPEDVGALYCKAVAQRRDACAASLRKGLRHHLTQFLRLV